LKGVLERHGMIVEAFERSPDALRRLLEKSPPPDAAILDMEMPEMDGSSMAQHIRAHPHLKHLPLMLLSSIMDRPPKDLFDAMITKPALPTQIIEALRGMLKPKLPKSEFEGIKALTDHMPHPSPVLILVVEDNLVNQKVMLLNLAKLGYRADLAADGIEAIKKMEKTNYDIVFMDVQMPRMHGLDATRVIRERGLCPNARIVALTAGVMEEDRRNAQEAGMDDFLVKPFTLAELRNVLNQIQHAA
jgi:CheY-like chemotaxis protein